MANDEGQQQLLATSTFKKFLPIVSFIILTTITLQTSLLELAEQRLWSHMIIEHAAFFALGSLSVISSERILQLLYLKRRQELLALDTHPASSHPSFSTILALKWASLLRKIFSFDTTGLLWFSIAVILMVLWHLPKVFDTAAAEPSVHIVQHISFIIVGASGYLVVRVFRESFRIFLLMALIGMMGFAGLLFSVLDSPVYSVYSIAQHNEAGGYMVLTSTLILIIGLPAYLIKRTISYVRARGIES